MAAIINRAFGAKAKASLSGYTDVATGTWYYDEMAKAVHMGTFTGNGDKLNPQSSITRQEAFLVLARAFKLPDGNGAALNSFKDKDNISSWAVGAVSALKSAGYLSGASGNVSPMDNMTRAEFAQMMDNMIKCYFKAEGTYTSVPGGNVMINVPNVTLKGVTVTGDLIIGDGVGNGDVILDSVTVTGRTVIRGGGVNSIKITGTSNLQNIIVASVDGQVRVYAQDGTEVGQVIVDGKDDVIIEGNVGSVTIAANDVTVTATNAEIGSVVIKGGNAQIIVASGSTVNTLTVDAPNATIAVSGSVANVVVNGEGTEVNGSGRVGSVSASANNVAVTTLNTTVTAATGTKGVIAGTTSVNGGNTTNTSSGDTSNTSTGNTGGSSDGGSQSGSHSSIPIPTISTFSPMTGPASGGTTVTITGCGTSTDLVDFTYVAPPVVSAVSPEAGTISGGTLVTITGTGFTGATNARFIGSGDADSFTVVSDTEITAVTPDGAVGGVWIKVYTPYGQSNDTVLFHYVTIPVVSSVSPTQGTTSGGNTVTITGSELHEATAVCFDGIPAESFTVVDPWHITAVIPAHDAGEAQVTVMKYDVSSNELVYFTYVEP